jgi:phage regulatory protein, rha family
MTKQEPEYVFSKLFHKETVPMTDSLKVADVFGKRHKNIIQAVKELDCSNEFRRLNFQPSYYLNEQNKRQPKFNMTQDGFTFLVMGFRGKKAAEFKEAYIKQFNEMREWISKREHLSTNQHILNDAIQMRFDGEHFAYSRENNLVYIVALGATRKKWLADNLYPNDVEIRECLNAKQLQLVELLTIENAVFIKLGMNYTERKTRLLETALHFERKGN